MSVKLNKSIFVVEDDQQMREYLGEVLSNKGYECVPFEHSAAVLAHMSKSAPPDLVLSDISMPGMSGLDLLRIVKAVTPETPFILLSGLYNLSSALSALRVGATDYLLKPAAPEDILKVVGKTIGDSHSTQAQVVREALSHYLNARHLSGGDSASLLMPLFDVLGFKRFETMQHSQRVAGFALLMGKFLGLDARTLEAIEIGSLLHDIGKVGIPHNVMMKPAKLTEEEWHVMKMHTLIGRELVSDMCGLTTEADIVYCHHERFDGLGYPRQLKGYAIPLGARIFSVADTLDAITSDRCYRKGKSIAEARTEIERMSGLQFDPAIVELLKLVPDEAIQSVRQQYPDACFT